MKKLCLVFLILLLSSACVSTKAYNDLSSRVQQLETKSKLTLQEAMLLAEQTGTNRFWWRNDVIGGGTALDGIAHGSLTDGDAAIVTYETDSTGYVSFWVYDSGGTNSDDPGSCTDSTCTRVAPNSGGGAWYRSYTMATGSLTVVPEGYRFWNCTNTDGYDGTPTEGTCYWHDDDNLLCCYDADAPGWLCVDFDDYAD